MKKFSLKLISVLLVMIFAVIGLSACSDKKNEVGTKVSVNTGEVVAVIDGKDITRDEVGEDLLLAEQDVISNYIYGEVYKEFFKDVEVTEDELTVHIDMMKAQVGEDQWEMYLAYYGGGNEEAFREQMISSLKQEKRIKEKSNSITLTDTEIKEAYDANPGGFDFVVMDAVYLGTEEELSKAADLVKAGKTVEEISKELNIEVSKDAHTNHVSEIKWSKDLYEAHIGETLYTTIDSGNYVVGKITAKNEGLTNLEVKSLIEEDLKYKKAFSEVEKEYIEFMKAKKVTIMGKEFPLYEEEEEVVAE